MDKYDLMSPSFWADPYSTLRQMQENDPVYWSASMNAWILTRYEDVAAAMSDNDLFSSDRNATAEKRVEGNAAKEKHLEEVQDFARIVAGMLFVKSGNEHKRLRKPMVRAFRDENFACFDEWVKDTATMLAEPLTSKTSFDVIREFAGPFALILLCRILGVPQSDMENLRQWTMDYAALLGAPQDEATLGKIAKPANDAVKSFENYFRQWLLTSPDDLPDGLIKHFVHAGREDGLNEDEIISQFVMLAPAGNMPVVDQIANTVKIVLSRPDIYAEIRQNRTNITTVTDEGLRYEPATFLVERIVTQDTVIREGNIRRGDLVMLVMGSANRDPDIFDIPEQFDIHRTNAGRNLTFGSGAHACLGMRLAVKELCIALETLLCDLPELKITKQPTLRTGTLAFRGYENLQVQWA